MPKKYPQAIRARFHAELEQSGEAVNRVARRLGLDVSTAYRWARAGKARAPVEFARVLPSSSASPSSSWRRSGVTLQLRSVAIVVEPEFDVAVLRAVVAALAEEVSR